MPLLAGHHLWTASSHRRVGIKYSRSLAVQRATPVTCDSNTMTDKLWYPLPHFTPYPLPDSMGVTMFSQDLTKFPTIMQRPYIFPPNMFVGPLLPFILAVIGGPCYKTTLGKHERSLGQVTDILLLPSREGWSCDSGIPGDLWAILVTFLYKL